jgi:hypothetical protein
LFKTNEQSGELENDNVTLERAIAILVNSSVEEIIKAFREVPRELIPKVTLAIGKVWQEYN